MSTDVLDNVESVNIPKFIPHYEKEPFHPFFNRYKAEIEAFSRVRHPVVLARREALNSHLSL